LQVSFNLTGQKMGIKQKKDKRECHEMEMNNTLNIYGPLSSEI